MKSKSKKAKPILEKKISSLNEVDAEIKNLNEARRKIIEESLVNMKKDKSFLDLKKKFISQIKK